MLNALRVIAPPPSEPLELPHNLDAEQALLGAMMIDNRLVEDVMPRVRAEHFFDELNGRIFEQIVRLADRGMVANPVTLKPLFVADAAMQAAGGPGYLAQLTDASAALIAAVDFAQQIYDLALLRELARVGRDMATAALDTSDAVDPKAQIEAAEMALYKVAEQGEVASGAIVFAVAATAAVHMAERAMKSGGHLSGITTGLDALNAKLGGLHDSDLVILAGRPAMGKTALATNIAFAAAKRLVLERGAADGTKNGAAVAFFSLEMSADQLATRLLAEQSGISSEQLRMGRISQAEFRQLARAAAELNDLPLYIDDTPALTIAALRTRARRLKRQRGIGLIVVDYLQLLQGTAKNAGENRVQEVSEITRGLKTLAKMLRVPVLALSQLSRAVEQREDKHPQLADLRESGTIEQDADIVMFVYREEYYHSQKKPEDGSEKFDKWLEKAHRIEGRAEVIVAKQRHGSTGIVPLMFHKETTRFADIADGAHHPERYG